MLLIDPPSGWLYDFPKPFTKPKEQDLDEWLLEQGYPQHLIDQGMSKYCRYITYNEENLDEADYRWR